MFNSPWRQSERPFAAIIRWYGAMVLTCLLVVLWVIAVPDTSRAGPLVPAALPDGGERGLSFRLEVAAGCGRLIRAQGQEYILNTCNHCLDVQIHRSRGGGALPVLETYRVEPKSRHDLLFKGPGSTRITNTENCAPETAAERQDHRAAELASAQCILIANTQIGYVLINRCWDCRKTVIRWNYDEGVQRNFELAIDARKSISVPRGQEIGLSVAHEGVCRG